MRRVLYVFILVPFLLLLTNANVSGQQNQLSLTFSELANTIQLIGKDVQVSKFSNTLKIAASGLTQYKGSNVSYRINITLPHYSYNDQETKTYQNEDNHFFDAGKDAAVTITIGNQTFGTLFRFKEKENVLSKIATTDYLINCKNIKDEKGRYLIQLTFKNGSILQESSELKSKNEEQKLTIADRVESKISIINPQPFPPKVKKHVFQSSSEVWKPNVRQVQH